MKQVWIVWGSSGEYDDYSEWVVAVYTTQAEAEKHRVAAALWMNDHATEVRDLPWQEWCLLKNPYDSESGIQNLRANVHYAVGTSYEVLKKFVPVA